VIDLACRYEVLVNFFAVDLATHGDKVVGDFKMRQAAEVTANLTSEHHPSVVASLHDHADKIRAMPNQLLLQAFLTIELILEAIQEVTLYYAQRLPEELGDIAWYVDRKDRTITQMEEMWTTFILPMGEGHFAKHPLKALIGADYSHFDARYGIADKPYDPKIARHMDWVQQVHGTRFSEHGRNVLNANLLLSDQLEFVDSRDSLGVQFADMLATILRRALNDRLQVSGWREFGKLLVRKGQAGSSFLQLGLADGLPQTLESHAKMVCLALDSRAKSMMLGDSSNTELGGSPTV